MGFSVMLAEESRLNAGTGIYSSTYRYLLHHGATCLRNINWSLFNISISNYL